MVGVQLRVFETAAEIIGARASRKTLRRSIWGPGGGRRNWLERIAKKHSRTALASGGLEPVADAGSGGHSVFAAALLGALRENSEIIEA